MLSSLLMEYKTYSALQGSSTAKAGMILKRNTNLFSICSLIYVKNSKNIVKFACDYGSAAAKF